MWIPRCIESLAACTPPIVTAADGNPTAEVGQPVSSAAPAPAPQVVAGNQSGTHAFVVCSTALRRAADDLIAAFALDTCSEAKATTICGDDQSKAVRVLHAFAAKANPLEGVLRVARAAGMGCEAASIGELSVASRVFQPRDIVYDSPVKTLEELRLALYLGTEGGGGVFINLDNFEELERVAALHAERSVCARVGLRINPQIGAGTIGQLSTGTSTSKFGIGLADQRKAIVAAFERYPFLTMLHVHTGSQGVGIPLMVAGVKAIVDLAEDPSMAGRVKVIDIGGGLPVNFASDAFTPTFADYATALRAAVPVLFSGRYSIITEFGRSLVAKAGLLVSRVEYVKHNGGRRILQQHIGADLAIRTVWQPQSWPLRIELFNGLTGTPLASAAGNDGRGGQLPDEPTDVAGPCCLGGDLLCADRMLPAGCLAMRDWVVAKDVGGYYHSSYSFYNLRAMPPSYLYDDDTRQFTCIHHGLSVDQTVGFYGLPIATAAGV